MAQSKRSFLTLEPEVRFQKCPLRDSPFDRALFRGIDLGQLGRAVEEPFHVVHQKPLGIGIGKIKAVMIDDARLRLQPFSPAGLANFDGDLLAQFGRERRIPERRTLLPTTGALDFIRHWFVSPREDYSGVRRNLECSELSPLSPSNVTQQAMAATRRGLTKR